MEEHSIASRVTLAPGKWRTCARTCALVNSGAATRTPWVRRLVNVAVVPRIIAFIFALAPTIWGALARTCALGIPIAATRTQWVLGLIVVARGSEV